MKRRDFIKLSITSGTAILLPSFTYSKNLKVDEITFSSNVNSSNAAQTIIIFLNGGASQLAGNLTNLEAINSASQNRYDYYFDITPTTHNFWKEAGGSHIEELIDSGDMTLFRSCFSKVREASNNKAHIDCSQQNQKGSFDDGSAGILNDLAQILNSNNIIDENSFMPFVTLESNSQFYVDGANPLPSYLKPVGIDEELKNPYSRKFKRDWVYYTSKEATIKNYKHKTEGFDASLNKKLDMLAQENNPEGKIKEAFSKRAKLEEFIKNISSKPTPELNENSYSKDNPFAKKLETAIKILSHNPDTKVITVGTDGLGGWDDHNQAGYYLQRSENLFKTLKSAIAHIKAEGKIETINIMVFSEFGRNVNLNDAKGWDHGNLQNFYVLGGKRYFNHKGIVGETFLENTGQINRLYLKPKPNTYWFEPLSIAATLYKIYGIENPEVLTGGYKEISPLFS